MSKITENSVVSLGIVISLLTSIFFAGAAYADAVETKRRMEILESQYIALTTMTVDRLGRIETALKIKSDQ